MTFPQAHQIEQLQRAIGVDDARLVELAREVAGGDEVNFARLTSAQIERLMRAMQAGRN